MYFDKHKKKVKKVLQKCLAKNHIRLYFKLANSQILIDSGISAAIFRNGEIFHIDIYNSIIP